MLVEADNAPVRGLTSPQRDRGRLTATTAPVSLPSFFLFLSYHSMGSGRTLKFALCEAKVKTSAQPPGDGSTAYWLIVASSIAYVTSTALLIWVPLKYMVFMKKQSLIGRKKWRPVALVYVILSTLPCFAFLIASSEVQVNNNMKTDTFTELPVSLVLFFLICVDVVERIRQCRLTGQANRERDADIPSTLLSHVEQVTPVAPIAPAAPGPAVPGPAVPTPVAPGASQPNDRTQNGAGARPEANGTVPGAAGNPGRLFSVSRLNTRSSSVSTYNITLHEYTGPLRFLCASDARADVFVDSFMFWMDTVEMVRVAGHPPVYYSGWVYPIYIFSYLSCLRVVVMPHSPLLSSLGVIVQDLPFFFVRVGLIALFGFVTPILYLMKNLLVCLAFVYFNL
ncbi:Transmembrane protein 236 [Collichthys lucidus]|uniref:Transmembrane protein 236 n=1 Tax=Collichthys lucidus TaxID=240159 RepID=A0A4U5VIJ7_COLLU|nr:Transmembrane protein 236 [Collichthys lucidus]